MPSSKVKEVAAMLKAIHAQEDRAAARQRAEQVAVKLKGMKLAMLPSMYERRSKRRYTTTRFHGALASLRTNIHRNGCSETCGAEREL